jgi:hypothetical protein
MNLSQRHLICHCTRFKRFLNAQFEEPLLKPEDNLWFFFAGHGKRFIDQDYLMFLDSDPIDQTTAISVDYVTQRLRRCGADNVVLLIDACRDEGDRSGLGVGTQEHKGVITFYSCAPNQKSWEIDELQHGSFTYSLLEGLRIQGEANCATVERLEQHYGIGYRVKQNGNMPVVLELLAHSILARQLQLILLITGVRITKSINGQLLMGGGEKEFIEKRLHPWAVLK